MKPALLLFIIASAALLSYTDNKQDMAFRCDNISQRSKFSKGEYGYDLEFLQKYLKPVELICSDSRLIIMPEYQGRVMTSSSSGLKGFSYGWINYDLIGSSAIQENFNPYGGEERIWLGPEGGQFSLFFKKDTSFSLANWSVPPVLDREPFKVTVRDERSVTLNRKFKLENLSGTIFIGEIIRKVTLLNRDEINDAFGKLIDRSVNVVAYRSENCLKNTGNNPWNKDGGALSVWMLSMLNPSPDVTVIIPYKEGDSGNIVSEYFGKIPDNRIKISDKAVFFLADGRFRSKIGISQQRAVPVIGSYDAKNNILTIIEFTLPETPVEYVNSLLKMQEEPFKGDVINSYNDGPADDNSQLGPFYELEISSPAAFLKPGEEIIHIQKTFHFEGSNKNLDKISKSLLNVSLFEISNVFGN